ncbi:Gfo/Idh/MocA family protein [Kushneria indalinina]|uniref:Putative dehydrogenase n=1 Tax=Kushneria indalinina DSM 14324 TaxID=1122140 RepID=A0A3D9DYL3_9GAMM|nr:Gfo/Idh/MocA family oxidoreductase [Kushneria indalinina]REC95880.1 putative dehydrogenase [Kushneria indalinina DSM 14324]
MQTAVLVGCGAMADGWLHTISQTPEIAESLQIVGFVDLDPTLAAAKAAVYGSQAAYGDDLAAMLDQLQPDMVFDIVIPDARREVVEIAFAHGCDVLSEKPLARDLTDARALLAEAESSGRVHAVIQNRRYLPGIQRARDFLASGAIGQVTEVHADFFLAPHFGGFREEMAHVLLHDMAIHTFDAARYLANIIPRNVFCRETNPPGSWYRHGASASALFDCENNVIFTYRGSWCAEGASTSWEAQWRIVGTGGTLVWNGNHGFLAEIPEQGEGLLRPMREVTVPPSIRANVPEGHAGVIADFLAARLEGRAPLTCASDNIHSLAMTVAAIESAETGRIIPISIQGDTP